MKIKLYFFSPYKNDLVKVEEKQNSNKLLRKKKKKKTKERTRASFTDSPAVPRTMRRREAALAARRKGNLFESLTCLLLTSHNCLFGMTIARTLRTRSSKSQPSQLGSRAFPQQKQTSKSQNKAIRRRARTAPAPEPAVPGGHGSGENTGPERASSSRAGTARSGSTELWHGPGGHGGKGRKERRAEGARAAGNGPDRAAAGGTSDRAAQAPAWHGAVSPSVCPSVSQSVCRARPASLTYSRTGRPAAASSRVTHPGASLRPRRAAGTESLVKCRDSLTSCPPPSHVPRSAHNSCFISRCNYAT